MISNIFTFIFVTLLSLWFSTAVPIKKLKVAEIQIDTKHRVSFSQPTVADFDPEEAGKFEGDIDMDEDELKRNALLSANKWDDGVVYYEMDSAYDLPMKLRIHVILKEFERLTSVNGKSCIRFVERTTQPDYVFLSPAKDACFSKLGRVGGRQVTMLGWPCFMANGKIMHEMMHVLGFLHEQSRPDRDNNVKIAWDNIIKGHDKNFLKYTSAQTNLGGMAYDYGSVMHYSQYAFSKNKQRTIIPLNEAGVRIGQRETLSPVDIAKIQMLYGCGTDTEGSGSTKEGASTEDGSGNLPHILP